MAVMKRISFQALGAGALLLAFASAALPAEFRAVTAQTLAGWLRDGRALAVVDVQPPEAYREHHFGGAHAAHDPGELHRVALVLAVRTGGVVIVSPAGGADALRAARLLAERGVAPDRIALLEGGMAAAVAESARCACCQAPGEGER